MQKKDSRSTKVVVAAGMSLAALGFRCAAQEPMTPARVPVPASQVVVSNKAGETYKAEMRDVSTVPHNHYRASSIIGMEVRNDQGEKLGKIDDLVISINHSAAPFAILEFGGALGIGSTRVAVPLSDFRYSANDRQLMLSATRNALETASATPTGAWGAISNEEWTKRVEHYYGQPSADWITRYERQGVGAANTDREFVRTPATKQPVGETLKQDARDLKTRVTQFVNQEFGTTYGQNVKVNVDNGVVTLTGQVNDESEKRSLENRIKSINGVERVDNRLTVKNK